MAIISPNAHAYMNTLALAAPLWDTMIAYDIITFAAQAAISQALASGTDAISLPLTFLARNKSQHAWPYYFGTYPTRHFDRCRYIRHDDDTP